MLSPQISFLWLLLPPILQLRSCLLRFPDAQFRIPETGYWALGSNSQQRWRKQEASAEQESYRDRGMRRRMMPLLLLPPSPSPSHLLRARGWVAVVDAKREMRFCVDMGSACALMGSLIPCAFFAVFLCAIADSGCRRSAREQPISDQPIPSCLDGFLQEG